MEKYTKLYQRYYDKELYMIGALDCFGVPHTPDNYLQKSYIDLLADDFKINGVSVNYVNMHSIAFNKTWELKSLMESDYTKKEYYDLNLVQSRKAVQAKNIFPFPLHDKFLSDYYTCPSNPNLKITSHLVDSVDPIFIYSCGQMNFHQYSKMRTEDLKQILPQLLFHSSENLERTLTDMKEMMDYLLCLNPTMRIYVFGVYPMFEKAMIRNMLVPFYKYANHAVKSMCDSYPNVYYVDVLGNKDYVAEKDVHPNLAGQCYMKRQVMQKILSTHL